MLWKGFQRPNRLEVEEEKNNYGRFTAQPLERGWGTTIGNALRRVLLSSIEGAAITAVKIEGVVTAAVFEDAAQLEILTADAPIATLADGGRLRLEATVNKGRGYVPADRNFDAEAPIGTIPIDSAHSPVRRVNYHVEAARVGQATDYDRLVLEVWTNGTVSPADAVGLAATLLRDHPTIFVDAGVGAALEGGGGGGPPADPA